MKFLFGVSYILVAIVVLTFAESDKPSMYKFRFLEVTECENTHTVINFKNLKVNRVSIDDYKLTGEINITEKADGPLWMGAKVAKCPEDINEDCVHVTEVIDKDLCQELRFEDSEAYKLLNNTFNIPKPKCPLEQSVRDIETDSVDMSQYEYVTEKAHRWKIDLLFYNADKKTINSCLHLHILIEKKTKKERQRDNKKWQQKQKQKESDEGSSNEGS